MTRISTAEQFVALSTSIKSLDSLSVLLGAVTQDLGFDYFALVDHKEPSRLHEESTLWLSNYPSGWMEHGVKMGWYSIDPVIAASSKTSTGFHWSEIDRLVTITKQQNRLMKEAANAGLSAGFSVPIHRPGEASSSCNFVLKDNREISDSVLMTAQLVGLFAHKVGSRLARSGDGHRAERPKLSQRMIDCVLHVARGLNDRQISEVTGLKEHTVRDYVKQACARYGVSRRIELALRAVDDGYVQLSDAVSDSWRIR